MWKPFLLAVVLRCESQAGKESYAGPNALGLFRVDRDVFVRSKVAQICCARSAAFHDRTHKNRRPLRSEVCATRCYCHSGGRQTLHGV